MGKMVVCETTTEGVSSELLPHMISSADELLSSL